MASNQELPDNGLRKPLRYITTHDSNSKAAFSTQVDDTLPWTGAGAGNPDRFSLAYVTNVVPADLKDDKDVGVYEGFLSNQPGLVVKGGTVLRYVDIAPNQASPMHRTVSLDYGVVIEGELEAVLETGEARLLKRGDIVVQRATYHAWRNPSKTEWARMLFVLVECEPLTLPNGETIGQGGI